MPAWGGMDRKIGAELVAQGCIDKNQIKAFKGKANPGVRCSRERNELGVEGFERTEQKVSSFLGGRDDEDAQIVISGGHRCTSSQTVRSR